jgi:CRP-like cAMP-binding protein
MGPNVIWWAAFWGGLSAVSLPLGAAIGLWTKPSRKITSSAMAFGGGSLLFALSIELFGHVLHEASDGHGHVIEPSLILAAIFAAILGGLAFNGLNKLLENRGGFMRRHVLIRRHVAKERRAEARQLVQSLSGVSYFRYLPVEDTIRLLDSVHRESYADGAVIMREGDEGDTLYVIAEGQVDVERNSGESTPEHIANLGPGNVIGEMALVTDQPRSATIIARGEVRAWSIGKSHFDVQMKASPDFRKAIGDVVEHRIQDLEDRGHVSVEEAAVWEQTAIGRLDDRSDSRVVSDAESEAHSEHSGSALAIWMGIALDAIPESLVIGMLTVAAAAVGKPYVSAAFIVGVFLANLPEAMSSSVTMQKGGMKVPRILLMWFSLTVMTATGAAIGAILLPADPTGWHLYAIFMMEGLAGGAMLTMIAQTMLPEAFEQGGGPIVGLSTLAGFLAALLVKLIN